MTIFENYFTNNLYHQIDFNYSIACIIFLLFSFFFFRFFSTPQLLLGLNHHLHHAYANGGHTHDSILNGTLTNCNHHHHHHDTFDNYRNNTNNNRNSSSPSFGNENHHNGNGMNGITKRELRKSELDLMNCEELEMQEREQLMEISLLRKRLQETENAMAKIIAQMGRVPTKGQVRLIIFVGGFFFSRFF